MMEQKEPPPKICNYTYFTIIRHKIGTLLLSKRQSQKVKLPVTVCLSSNVMHMHVDSFMKKNYIL